MTLVWGASSIHCWHWVVWWFCLNASTLTGWGICPDKTTWRMMRFIFLLELMYWLSRWWRIFCIFWWVYHLDSPSTCSIAYICIDTDVEVEVIHFCWRLAHFCAMCVCVYVFLFPCDFETFRLLIGWPLVTFGEVLILFYRSYSLPFTWADLHLPLAAGIIIIWH